jgi:hypothetical protein
MRVQVDVIFPVTVSVSYESHPWEQINKARPAEDTAMVVKDQLLALPIDTLTKDLQLATHYGIDNVFLRVDDKHMNKTVVKDV